MIPQQKARQPSNLGYSRACDRCRIRKVKCDTKRPRCTACEKYARSTGTLPEEFVCYYRGCPQSCEEPPSSESNRKLNDLENRIAMLEDTIEAKAGGSWKAYRDRERCSEVNPAFNQASGVVGTHGQLPISTQSPVTECPSFPYQSRDITKTTSAPHAMHPSSSSNELTWEPSQPQPPTSKYQDRLAPMTETFHEENPSISDVFTNEFFEAFEGAG